MNVSAPFSPPDALPAPSPAPAQRRAAHPAPALRALIWKDVRRTLPLVAVILGIQALLASTPYIVHQLNPQAQRDPFEPNILANYIFLGLLPYLTAFIGVGLGVHIARQSAGSERWAFLMHRPLARSRIFLARLVAALFLYAVAAGVPAVLVLIYAAFSYDLPYHWRMALPVVVAVAGGGLYVFAGMVLVERRAFIAVRFVPVIAAVVASVAALWVASFSVAMLVIFFAAIMFALAAMGAHISDGNALRAPAATRAAITMILFAGVSVVLMTLGMMVKSISLDRFRDAAFSFVTLPRPQIVTTFCFLPDGSVGREVMRMGDRLDKHAGMEIDPSGVQHPIYMPLDSDTPPNPPITGDMMDQMKTHSALLSVANFHDSYGDMPQRIFGPAGNETELWYAIPAAGVVRGYEAGSHALIGTIGVDGFAAPGHSARPFTYSRPLGSDLFIGPRGLYQVDLNRYNVHLAYEVPEGMTVHAVGLLAAYHSADVRMGAYYAVLTDDRLLIYASTWNDLLADAVAPSPLAATLLLDHKARHVQVTHFRGPGLDGSAGKWGLAYSDAAFSSQDQANADTLYAPKTFDLFDAAGKRIEHHQFTRGEIAVPPPPPEDPRILTVQHAYFATTGLGDALTSLPAFEVIHRVANPEYIANRDARSLAVIAQGDLPPNSDPWYAVPAAIVLVLCGTGMLWLTRRYQARLGVAWVAWAVVCGPAVVLAFLCMHSLPRREPCPTCGRKRLITAVQCPHCHAEFPHPVATGTEIFNLSMTR